MRIVVSILLVIFILFIKLQPAYAAKKFVPKRGAVKKSYSTGIPASVKFRPDRLGILLSMSNFKGINSVSYSFTYDTRGNPQGAGGTITANNNPTAQRELLFGTCSTSVCTYHSNLSDAKLVLSVKYLNGRKATKIYRIKTSR